MASEVAPDDEDEARRRYEEYLKLVYDLSKHHTTLSTVTAALIAGLFKNEFQVFSWSLYGTMILFALSVILAVIAMVMVMGLMRDAETKDSLPPLLYGLHIGIVATTVGALVSFALYLIFFRS